MARRPQSTPRRGVARAVGAGVLLIVVLLVAILVTSSLTAPSAQAPTPPPTPGPIKTATVHGTGTPGSRPTPAVKKTSQLLRLRPGAVVADLARSVDVERPENTQGPTMVSASASPDGRHIAYFSASGDGYAVTPLVIAARGRVERVLAGGDSLVRPIWSAGERNILFVRAVETPAFPGTRWSLMRADIGTGKIDVLAEHNAIALTPLGWLHGRALYLVANSTDTSIYAATPHGPQHIGILEPAPIVSAALSPTGRTIVTSVPANCTYCTLHLYNTESDTLDVGPSGVAGDSTYVWTQDGKSVVTVIGKRLAILNVDTLRTTYAPLPSRLPHVWQGALHAVATGGVLRLIDPMHRLVYSSRV